MDDPYLTLPPEPIKVEKSAPEQPQRIGRYRIERVLGEGGFGLVYLAHDDQLQRPVAIKVPHPHLVSCPEDAEAYLTEARTVASLDHPHIVPVHDVGSTEQFPCFVVSKFIEGSTLTQRIKANRPSWVEAVELVATVAETLSYAHKKGIVHRDIKPGNILLDTSGKPFVADFGLALREADVGKGPRYAGTPAYMSPEQARGEGHRVDGRSDIFSLGVVLYELLTGRRPFLADGIEELLEQITSMEARPPRQWDDSIPKELERICLKVLSKRASDRYSTGKDMADDLRHWFNNITADEKRSVRSSAPAAEVPSPAPAETPVPSRAVTPAPDSGPVRIVPKGLRSFDAHDADFFLELLPGPRDREGLPDSIRFWKTRIEEKDADNTFAVGLICGPSGCGKSSLVKAGLLPRLAKTVTAVYIEATAEETEARLLKGLRRQVPDLPGSLGLIEALAEMRRGRILASGQKVLLVLDQFEQWLHAKRNEENTQLVQALRQCDGSWVQCIVMVRDDFWMAVIRFMRDLEIRLLEGQNSAAVDLFPIRHAEKVLRAFGRAFGALPEADRPKPLDPSLQAMVSRLEHVADPYRELRDGVQKAIQVADVDPEMALTRTRKVLEYVIRDVYERRIQEPPGTRPLENLLQRIVKDGHFPDRLDAYANTIRKLGNVGTHTFGEKVAVTDVYQSLTQLVPILDWYFEAERPEALTSKPIVAPQPSSVPGNLSAAGEEHQAFLEQAVSGLAQDGKVICVRLALFAEMMKGKTWTPATLREVGGTEGIGVTFLEETFSAATAPPEHRYHQKAARAVLKALLPEAGTEIKGHMRSQQELQEASGYASRPRDFEDLLRILDSELRLLTPTDPEGKEDAEPSTVQDGGKYYQLTHDYLVPSLRDWLTRKQKETRRGRAELLLADRAVVWNARPENRQLPSLLQWLQIRWLTEKKHWTPPQRKMMRKAGRYHAVRALAVAVCLTVLGLGGWEGYGRLEGRRLRDRLLESTTADVPGIVKDMAPYRRWLDPLLQEAYAQAEKKHDPRKKLHASLALLPVDAGQLEYLLSRLLQGQPQEVLVIREALSIHKQCITERLWALLKNPKNDQDERLRAASALASFAPDDPRWNQASGDVAAMLVIQKPFVLAQWTEALQGVGRWLLPPLADLLMDKRRSVSERSVIGTVYGRYAADTPNAYARLEKGLTETTGPDATPEEKVALAKKHAGIGVALVAMGQGEKVWPLLKHSSDPTRRSYLIEWMGLGGVDAKVLTARLEVEKEVAIRRALLLSLGEYGQDRLSQAQLQNLLPRLLHLYQEEPDPGIHGDVEWLIRQWQGADQLKALNKKLATGKVQGKQHWYVNKQGQTMIVVPKPGEVWMGEGKERHRWRIDRSFALASKEVTIEQFRRFRPNYFINDGYSPSSECPVLGVRWYEAMAYCNWLSEQEGIPRDQWCYEPNKEGGYAAGMKMAPNYLKRTGYRLPTGGEWEYGCRAGAVTGYSYGRSAELLGKYAWFSLNSAGTSHPVGILKPNDLGLFDMHGNAVEWCQDFYFPFIAITGDDKTSVDLKYMNYIDNIDNYDKASQRLKNINNAGGLAYSLQCGSSFFSQASSRPTSYGNFISPSLITIGVGFRPARTYR